MRNRKGIFYPAELDVHAINVHAIDVFRYNLWEPGSLLFHLSGCTIIPSWNKDKANAAIAYYCHVNRRESLAILLLPPQLGLFK